MYEADSPPGSSPARYRAHLLVDARPTDRGIVYRRGEEHFLLEWSRVRCALAAEVGEPEGIRTTVFDLVVGLEGQDCVAFRFDAEPGEETRSAGRAIELGVGAALCDFSLRSAAADGYATRQHPDLEAHDEASLESLRFKLFE